jgi:hypothetical protein
MPKYNNPNYYQLDKFILQSSIQTMGFGKGRQGKALLVIRKALKFLFISSSNIDRAFSSPLADKKRTK